MKVKLFIPCFVDQLYPQVGMNTVKILEKVGCEVEYNDLQTCCGQPAYNAGYMDEARVVSSKFVEDFKGEEYIVAPSGSCVGYVRGCFEELFDKSIFQKDCMKVSSRAYELSEFLVDILKIKDIGAEFHGKVAYHDACGALRECGIKSQPRELLKHVKGLELVEMKEAETCCGFGGTFAIKYEPISIGMAQTKIQSAAEVKADYMVSTDISCLMHVEGHLKHSGSNLKVKHLADILAANL